MDAPLNPEASRFQKVDKVVLLSQCPLFSGLSQWELRSISQLMRLVEFKKDEIVYSEGGEGEGFYVVVSGRFEAFVTAAEKKRVLAYLRRGDYFGEMSLLTDQPHSATIRALSDSLVLEIKKDGFKKSIEHNATISLELSRRLSSRLKLTESRSRSLFKSDVLSIYGGLSRSQREMFSVNLAACLMGETHQRTVLIDLARSDTEEPAVGLESAPRIPLKSLENAHSWSDEDLKKALARHRAGFDYLCIGYEPGDVQAADALIPLLNHLSIEYRFILVDLSDDPDEVDMKAVSQSDALFVITDSHLNSLTEAKETIREIERTLSFPEEKIAVVVQEVVFGAQTGTALRHEMFGKKRCFSLPLPPSGSQEAGWPLVAEMPDNDYSRSVRHIARFHSGNLVGLALGSGAAYGLAHIGVLKVLEREKIPIDIVAGSSIGALIGSLYAMGQPTAEIEKAATDINLRLLFGRLLDLSLFPLRGLMHGKQVIRHFRKTLHGKTFEQCRIPLKVTGANLTTRQSFVMESGSVAEAVRTSIAIPAIFKPVIRDSNVLVDGGILNPLPIRALHLAGANKVIAVNVFPTTKDMLEKQMLQREAIEKERTQAREKGFFAQAGFWFRRTMVRLFTPNIFDILMNTIQAMEAEIAEVEGEAADVLLRPVLPSSSWVDFYKAEPFIRRGEEEAMKMLPKIKALVSQQNV